jgi:hypothetical protein
MPGYRRVPLKITVDGEPTRSETVVADVGAYVLVIATALPDLALDLHSTYTGHERAGTIAAHLILARDAYKAFAQEHDHDVLPVTHARRGCLYDHLHRLQELLQEPGMQASIPIEEDAIHAVEHTET